MRISIALLAVAAVFMGCNKGNKATIQGRFFGEGKRSVYLEQLSPGNNKIVDSVQSSSKGSFRFKVEFKDETPAFYNVRMGGSFVPLLVAPGEKVAVDAVGNIYNNYTVRGSEGSMLMRELSHETIRTIQRMDSIANLFETTKDDAERQRLGVEHYETSVRFKQDVIKFVVRNSNSLAVIVPFFQPIDGSTYIFDAAEDMVYLKMITDSLGARYPNSPYVRSLRYDISVLNQAMSMDSLLTSGELQEIDFPDIEMKDAVGKSHRLSDLKGNVILLDFTTTGDADVKRINRDMVEIYEKFAPKGLEIYQVSLDMSKVDWMNSLAETKLPWISVCDFMGSDSPAVKSYNVQKVPSNFLIDRSGDIVDRDLYGDALEKKLASLMAGR